MYAVRGPFFVLVAGWLYLLFLHGLADRDLWNSHEARAGMDARAVLDGDWLLPRLHDGRPELQKPPLYYWLVATVAWLRGGTVDAWAVRLPSALAALGGVAFLCVLCRACGRAREGLLAAAVLATAVHFAWLARVGRIDMPLTLTVAVALGCFYLAHRGRGRTAPLLAAYLALAAALLLKGPIGVVLTASAFGAYLLAEGELPPPWHLRRWGDLAHRLGLWWGLPLVAALAAPWFWLANEQSGGELARVFFWHHNLERGLGGSRLRSHAWWFYGPQLLLDFLPWGLVLVPAVVYFLRRGRWREDAEARFGLAWAVAMAAVLSCARYKRADYLVPAYPGLALFLGCTLLRWYREYIQKGPFKSFYLPVSLSRCLLVLVLVGSALGWWVRVAWVLPRYEARREHRSFAGVVRGHAPPPDPVYLFQTEAHALSFHLGRPVEVLLHWEQLDALPGPHHVVMPTAAAEQWRQHLRRARLEEVARNGDGAGSHEKPLVLFRLQARPTSPERQRRGRPVAGAPGLCGVDL